jgi:flagellar protein FliS
MLPAHRLASYKTVAVDTASPGRLILMLFDGALRFLRAAEEGFRIECPRSRQEAVHNGLIRSQAIIQELQRALNLREGGEFAINMFRLYDFMNTRLMEANLKKEPENIRVVAGLLGQVREAWDQMLREQSARHEQPAGMSMSA